MNKQQKFERLNHHQVEIGLICKVEEKDSAFLITIGVDDGEKKYLLKKPLNRMPKVGQEIKVYVMGNSYPQGVDLEGKSLFYKSTSDLEAETKSIIEELGVERSRRENYFLEKFNKSDSDLLQRINSLPTVFRLRLNNFFAQVQDFWKVVEYELTISEMASRIADFCKRESLIDSYCKKSLEGKLELIKTSMPNIDKGVPVIFVNFSLLMAQLYLENEKEIFGLPLVIAEITSFSPT